MRRVSAIVVGCCSVAARPAAAACAATTPGMSLFGDLKYGPDFKHFDYVNPEAPKGGTMRLLGDRHLRHAQPLCHQRRAGGRDRPDLRHACRCRSEDEPSSEYGLVAENDRARPRQALGALHVAQGSAVSRRNPDDPRGRRLDLRDVAREGATNVPLLLRRRDQGREGGRARRPLLRSNRRKTANCRRSSARCRCCRRLIGRAAISKRRRSTRRSAAAPTRSNRSIPAARSPIAGSPITGRPICRSTRAATMSIRSVTIIIATRTIALEAFKAGQYDVRLENSSKDWATGYDSPALRAGLIKKEADPERAAERYAGLRVQFAPAAVPGSAGPRGARLCLRFRMVEQEFVLRRLYAHAQLFRQF